jgi:hypothetical protein
MLHFRTIRHFPEVFSDRREQRYLTPQEATELAELKGPAARSPWLLTRLAAKGLVQHFLSEHHDLWIPENAIGIRGVGTRDGHCDRLQVLADGPFEHRLPDLVVRAVSAENTVLCAVEPDARGKRFALAVQPIDAGFPFFLDEPLSEEEVMRLADIEEEFRNGQVAASLAIKRALLSALTLEKAGVDEAEFVVGPIEYGQPVGIRGPRDLIGRRRVFAWADIVPPLAVAYVAVLDPGFDLTSANLHSDVSWFVDPHKNGRAGF